MKENKITGNEPVTPLVKHTFDKLSQYSDDVFPVQYSEGGLTIRQHFAAMAMQGISTSPAFTTFDSEDVARLAVKRADALIKELNK